MLVCHPFSAGTLFIISYSKDLRRTTARMHGFGKHFFHGSRVAQAARTSAGSYCLRSSDFQARKGLQMVVVLYPYPP